VTAAAGAPDGRYHVSFNLTTASGEHRTVALAVAVAKLGELWPYFTNAGITDDTNTSAATYDGGGWSYSAQALAAQGVTPGGTVTVNGIGYTWPDVPVATLDNIEAAGQTIPLAAPAHASTIGLLGSATNAGSAGAGGTATVTYTDGTTSQFTAMFSDWTLGAGGFPPVPGNSIAVAMPYRNAAGNQRDNVKTYVFAMEAPVSVAKTVASITLPQATGGDMHVFAITLPPAPAHAVTLTPAAQKGGGRAVGDRHGEADHDRGHRRHAHRRRRHGRAERGELLPERVDRGRRRVQLLGPVRRPDGSAVDADRAQEGGLVHRQRLPRSDHGVRVGARDVPGRRRTAVHVRAGHPRPVGGYHPVRAQLPAHQLGRLGNAERQADGERARRGRQPGEQRHRDGPAGPLGAQRGVRGSDHTDRPGGGGLHRRLLGVGRADRRGRRVQGGLPGLPVRGV